jgi:glycosyltransferase involved in cell wall biosynthesis
VVLHFATPEDLPELCASADLGVSIASTDATPASMVESMASGLPMIMGDAVTIGEWITQGEGGEVVGCRDEDALTEALLKLLRDPDLRRAYGQRNERIVRERLGDPGEQLEALYLRMLSR